jgi:hypothetical protein
METVVLDVDDRGRISVGKYLGGAERVIVTTDSSGRLVIEPAVVVRAMLPRIRQTPGMVAEIDASLGEDQIFVPRKARPKKVAAE